MPPKPVRLNRRQCLQAGLATAGLALTSPRSLVHAEPPRQSSLVATGSRGAVATVHPLASHAAIEAFERGGNAIDAAVAASLMLSVVDPDNSGLGGGGLALVRFADGTLHAIDGRERAPLSATPEMFFHGDQPDPKLSQIGPLAAGVPGLVALLDHLAKEHGRIAWNAALVGAAQVAERGFEVTASDVANLNRVAPIMRQFPESTKIFLPRNGQPPNAGEMLIQTDLARTLSQLADHGSEWFYRGEFAQAVDKMMRQSGGQLTNRDLDEYTVVERTPIQTPYRDHRIVGFPPPSSGGIHIAQMLGMLQGFDVAALHAMSPVTLSHLLLEVMKRAMADRAHWLGDADFAKVPTGLLDAEYLNARASDIDLQRAVAVMSHGNPPRADSDWFSQKHTTHLTTADSEGNVVALTQTINTSYGNKMVVPGMGVVLNNEMDDFSIAPGIRNAFGLVGASANAVAPGKRPLSSMSPTIVLNDAQLPVLTCGAAGGPKIITAVLQVLVRCLDLNQTIGEAIESPRLHHQWSPDIAILEQAFEDSTTEAIKDLGHDVARIQAAAVAQGIAIKWSETASRFATTAAADPRANGSARALSQ